MPKSIKSRVPREIQSLNQCDAHTRRMSHLYALQGLPSGQVTMDLGNIELTKSLFKAGLHVFHLDHFVLTDYCL